MHKNLDPTDIKFVPAGWMHQLLQLRNVDTESSALRSDAPPTTEKISVIVKLGNDFERNETLRELLANSPTPVRIPGMHPVVEMKLDSDRLASLLEYEEVICVQPHHTLKLLLGKHTVPNEDIDQTCEVSIDSPSIEKEIAEDD